MLLTKLCFAATSLLGVRGVFHDIFIAFDIVYRDSLLLKLKQLDIGEKYYGHAFVLNNQTSKLSLVKDSEKFSIGSTFDFSIYKSSTKQVSFECREVFADYSFTTVNNLANSSLDLNEVLQKQPREVFCKIMFLKIRKFHRKAPVLKSLFKKIGRPEGLQLY